MVAQRKLRSPPIKSKLNSFVSIIMAGSPKAQGVADVALGSAAAAARLTRAGRSPTRAGSTPPSGVSPPSPLALLRPAQLAFSPAKPEVAWGAADDAAAAKKAADERQKQVEEDLRKMLAMMERLNQDLASERAARFQMDQHLAAERAARIQLQKVVQSWEEHYREEQDAGDGSAECPRRLLRLDEEDAEAQGPTSYEHYHFDDEPVGPPLIIEPPGYTSDAKDAAPTCEDLPCYPADDRGWRQAGKADP